MRCAAAAASHRVGGVRAAGTVDDGLDEAAAGWGASKGAVSEQIKARLSLRCAAVSWKKGAVLEQRKPCLSLRCCRLWRCSRG